MYYIALCDDKPEELDKSKNMLKLYQDQHPEFTFSIRQFQKAEELLWMVQEKNYTPDLLIIDIFMPGKLGVDTAKELRKMGSRCSIIFLTISREYALEAFQVDAVQYLLKPISQHELFQVLDKVWKKINEGQKKYLLIRIGSSLCRIPVQNILYIEAQKKCQQLYLNDGTQYLLRLTMAKLYEMLAEYKAFAKAGVSYIVNLIHVESISTQMIHLDNGKQIYLPRGAYPAFKKQYFQYYCEEDG
ncbi:MAG: LytTR family DNA-binding domain-containing protein [Eubacterium sp.]|nr:LytTR family DNA-binding domain-containing protein [Eubacterium sp.]